MDADEQEYLEPDDQQSLPEEVSDTESLKNEIAELREKAQSYLANWQRTQADLDNFRRRVEQERQQSRMLADTSLVRKVLAPLDDLERAFSRPASEMRKASWVEGARVGFDKLKAALASEGLEPIEALGQEFNPRLHEAVMKRVGEEGVVVEEVQKGYTLHSRLLRPSMVVVGVAEEAEEIEQDQ
ncbi:MAG: nucleotide exchange factor GrpE [Dehalococcoidia bacterium]|nr:nucleotide exchange factor GrpE [Dehalococcoidia bacterium]